MTLLCLDVYSDIDDLFDVRQELLPLSAQWLSIGIALRLNISTLNHIEARNIGDPSACLNSMVMEWLKWNYNIKRYGEPTWQRLVNAVANPTGGANRALAMEIARRHKTRGMPNSYICCTVGRFHIL